jgi:SAM-dependent methyltransferase
MHTYSHDDPRPRASDTSEWYREAFDALYPLLYPQRSDEAAAREMAAMYDLLRLHDPGERVLDLACGTARHCQALAERGVQVCGLDLSRPLLEIACRRSCLAGCLVRGDMRRLPFRRAFDVVISIFTSFGYFADDRSNAQVLAEIARVLVPGGRLLIDHINRPALERSLVPEDEREGPGFRIRQQRRVSGNRVKKRIEILWADGRTRKIEEDVRLFTPGELRALLEEAGFSAVRFYGSFQGGALTESAERMIALAVKAS